VKVQFWLTVRNEGKLAEEWKQQVAALCVFFSPLLLHRPSADAAVGLAALATMRMPNKFWHCLSISPGSTW
jgi:hypothetical protein